jgi:hypothetical protein
LAAVRLHAQLDRGHERIRHAVAGEEHPFRFEQARAQQRAQRVVFLMEDEDNAVSRAYAQDGRAEEKENGLV